jgi:uncharacterized protein
MAWLMREGKVLASAEVAASLGARLRGLVGRDSCDGVLVIMKAKSVHTFGMRFPIDVAFCDRELTVLATTTMRRARLGRPRLRARCVVEAEAGAFERWQLRPGDHLEITG